MGVKEYRFLTRTMKTIGTRSNKLVKEKGRLLVYGDELKDFRKRARRIRANEKKKRQRTIDGESLVKEKIANLEAKRKLIATHYRPWGSEESLRKEIRATREELEPYYKSFFFRLFNGQSFDRLREQTKVLTNRKRIVMKEDKDRWKIDEQIAREVKRLSKIDSELKNPKKNKELSGLETEIEELVKLGDSTKKEIKLLEKEIPQLWDSIAHLIPFSTALEKA